MAHIWSDDNTAGFTYDGTWTLQSAVSGILLMAYHHIDDGDIPWIYAGIDGLVIDDGGGDVTVSFGTISSDKSLAATATAMEVIIDAALGGTTVTIVYVAATDTFDMTFSVPVILRWTDVLSTSTLVFNTVGAADTANLALHSLSGRYVDERPPVLEMEVSQGVPGQTATRVTNATFFIPTADFQIRDIQFQVNGVAPTLDLMWSRVNAPGVALPLPMQWELQFV